ncbi:hypothetical protein GQ600_3735 [Phytophthora cactorum]|nr:hypothetical protein GQ600_3735 [Phytophthora cactorum]
MNLSFECCSSSSDIRVRIVARRRAKDAVGQAESSTAATWAFQSVCKMERLARQVQETQKLLSYPGTNWQDCSSAVDELATAVEAIGPSTSRKDAARLIGTQLASLRSRLVKDTCECLLRIVKVMERDFQDMANALLPQVIGTAKSALAAIRQPGS